MVTIDDVIIPSLISFHEKWAFRMRFFLISEVDTLYFVLIGAVSKYYNNLEKLALIITSWRVTDEEENSAVPLSILVITWVLITFLLAQPSRDS